MADDPVIEPPADTPAAPPPPPAPPAAPARAPLAPAFAVLLAPLGGLIDGQIVTDPDPAAVAALIASGAARAADPAEVERATPFHFPIPASGAL
jgi:hypothetical protein